MITKLFTLSLLNYNKRKTEVINYKSMSNSVVNSNSTTELQIRTENRNFEQGLPPPYTPVVGIQNTTQIIHETIIVQSKLKDEPTLYNCPTCREMTLTKVKYVNSRKTHLIAGFIGGFTFWCMLCCLAAVPYLLPMCKKAEHYCANCDTYLGTYSKF